MTLGHELRALDAMNKLRLWMICATLSHKLRALVVIHKFGLSMT